MSPRPMVVITNDDGVRAPGILALARAMRAVADVAVVAPESEQSSTSHALTLHRPLRLREHGEGVWSLDGTPADCTYVALRLREVVPRAPDLVLSGINMGSNLGNDVFYSGTVAGAREAALRGVPGVAFSMPGDGDARRWSLRARALVQRLLSRSVSAAGQPAPLLNVNFPAGPAKGVRVCSLGVREYDDVVDLRRDPRGKRYLWLGGPNVRHPEVPGSDTEGFEQGYVTVTALRLDLTLPDQDAARAMAGRR
ncbi:MAG: 5'/3'-nucleotidase SurE [Polyangiales bacterium]